MTKCLMCGMPPKYIEVVRALRKEGDAKDREIERQEEAIKDAQRELSTAKRRNQGLSERNERSEGKLRRLRNAINKIKVMR